MKKKPERQLPRIAWIAALIVLLVIAFGLAVYTWNALGPSLQTSVLTIIGGVLIYVGGQVGLKGFIEPIQALNKTIGEINAALVMYGNTAATIISHDRRDEAMKQFRKLAGDLLGNQRTIPLYRLFEWYNLVPTRRNVLKACNGLILLSNTVGTDHYSGFDEGRAKVQDALELIDPG